MMCSQGRSRADEGTAGSVTSEWHQRQVESVWGMGGAGLSGGKCRPSKLGSGRWPLRNMAKTASSAEAACRYSTTADIAKRVETKFVCPASQRSTMIEDVLIHILGNAVTGCPRTQARIWGQRTFAMGPVHINKGCHVKCGGDINFVRVHGSVGVTHSGVG
jgi:hypothetical protein